MKKNKRNLRVRLRAIAQQGNTVGKHRYQLYQYCHDRISDAIKRGWPLEAVTLIESLFSDRMESRLTYLRGENCGFQNLGPLIQESKNHEVEYIKNADYRFKANKNTSENLKILTAIDRWRDQRNKALHEMVKIEDGKNERIWGERMSDASHIAQEGYELLKAYSNAIMREAARK